MVVLFARRANFYLVEHLKNIATRLTSRLRAIRLAGETPMARKQSTPKVSTLASKVLSGDKKPTVTDAKRLAASVLSQDEKKGQRR